MEDVKYSEACKILGLNSVDYLNYKTLRSAYLKKSLRYHPDKNGGKDEEFKKIVCAYEKLYEYLSSRKEVNGSEEKINSSYSKILEEIINEIININAGKSEKNPLNFSWKKEFIVTTIKSLLKTFLNKSFTIFDNLDSNTCMEIYDFLVDFNDTGFIDKSYLKNLKKILQRKINNVVILEPSLNDLMNDKIYKLEMFEKTFYVPLWHNELIFDYQDENEKINNFIVKIEPVLDDNYFIDEKNDIFVKKALKFSDLEVIYKSGCLDIEIGNKVFKILSSHIRIAKESQTYKLEGGILKINQDDMFCSKDRGSVHIELNILQ